MSLPRNLVIHNIADLVTMAPLTTRGSSLNPISDDDLGRVKNGWIAIESGKVKNWGSGDLPATYNTWSKMDARGGLVLPGFVDCHTHPVFAGSRAMEFAMKLRGATYQEIAAQGGGITYTVAATRNASSEVLLASTLSVLAEFLRQGVTTLEVKSGYGLTVAEELRHLAILNDAKKQVEQELSITCLALHAVAKEAASTADFVGTMTQELLPEVHRQGLAQWADAFIEEGYFSVAQAEPYIMKAKELGFGIRIHADEFSDGGAALAAARWGAASADHLECSPKEALMAMAKAGTVAVILPGTSLYSNLPFAKAKHFLASGVPLAIASDYNPGSCRLKNLPMLAATAAVQCRLDLAHVLAAITYIPAHSLRLAGRKGALAPGFDADLLIFGHNSAEEWIADFGQTPPQTVMIRGHVH